MPPASVGLRGHNQHDLGFDIFHDGLGDAAMYSLRQTLAAMSRHDDQINVLRVDKVANAPGDAGAFNPLDTHVQMFQPQFVPKPFEIRLDLLPRLFDLILLPG